MKISLQCTAILALVGVVLAAPHKSRTVGQPIGKDGSLQDEWTSGNCGNYVKSQDLVYYDHATIQANSASSTLTDTVSWTGVKRIYCVEAIGNQGTQLKITSGGVGSSVVQVYGVSAVGKDLDARVYVYAS